MTRSVLALKHAFLLFLVLSMQVAIWSAHIQADLNQSVFGCFFPGECVAIDFHEARLESGLLIVGHSDTRTSIGHAGGLIVLEDSELQRTFVNATGRDGRVRVEPVYVFPGIPNRDSAFWVGSGALTLVARVRYRPGYLLAPIVCWITVWNNDSLQKRDRVRLLIEYKETGQVIFESEGELVGGDIEVHDSQSLLGFIMLGLTVAGASVIILFTAGSKRKMREAFKNWRRQHQ